MPHRTALHRLYKTKLVLFAVICGVLGLALLVLARALDGQPGWLHGLPLAEVGATLLTTSLVVIFFEYLDREDAEDRAHQRLRHVLREEAPAIRDAVVDGFAFHPEALANVSSPEVLDRLARNCLAAQLGDAALAEDLHTAMRQHVAGAHERTADTHVSVALSRWNDGPASGPGSMFVATIRWAYRVVPASPVMRFACTSNRDDYRELLHDPAITNVWYFESIGDLDGTSEQAFHLLELRVNGKLRSARRSTRAGTQVMTVNLGTAAKDQEITVSYSYRVLIQRNGHLLHLDIARPSQGLKVQFWYGDCGIRHVSVLDYLGGSQQTRITQSAHGDPKPGVEISTDRWVFPKAGVGFVWVVEEEMSASTL